MSKGTIKMIALDLDGTTLGTDSRISGRTKRALALAMERGVHIVVSTGRGFGSVPHEVLTVKGLEYIITSNGANVRELATKRTIYENHLSPEATEAVIKIFENRDISVEAVIDGSTYMEKKDYDRIKQYGLPYRNSRYVIATRKPVDGLFDYMRENRGRIENINITFVSLEEKAKWRKILEKVPDVTLTSSYVHNCEIGGKTTSKAEALKFLMDRLDVAKEELLACGDNRNDGEMIKFAGIGVAMGNALEDVKAMADYVADTNGNDGVAKVIEKFVLS